MKIGISWIVYPIFCKQERNGFQISWPICSPAAGHCLLGQHKPVLVSGSQSCHNISSGHPAAPRPSNGCRKAFCWDWWSWDLARPHSLLGQSLPQPLGDVLRQTGDPKLPWVASNSPKQSPTWGISVPYLIIKPAKVDEPRAGEIPSIAVVNTQDRVESKRRDHGGKELEGDAAQSHCQMPPALLPYHLPPALPRTAPS